MKNLIIVIALFLFNCSASADTLFAQGFEQRPVERQFPFVGGSYQLPDYPVSPQTEWLIEQFSLPDTSLADIDAHFDLSAFGMTAQQMRDFLQNVRTSYPNAEITDVIMGTPVRMNVVMTSQTLGTQVGIVQVGTEYTGLQRINYLYINGFSGSVVNPVDQGLTMTQALDKFETLSSQPSFLVAEIDNTGACIPLYERNSNQLRALASVYKIWLLTAAAEAFFLGDIDIYQNVSLVASELAPGGIINGEPLGTQFPLFDIATLSLGLSDNTAADLLHEVIGRDFIELVISSLGLSNPEDLIPLLNISEQNHLFWSFPLATALDYVNGTEAFQQQFLEDEIIPLGPFTTFLHNNYTIMVNGSWRATAMDICKTYAHLRDLPQGSSATLMTDVAMGSNAAFPNVRNYWDKVWYKGGDLVSGTNGMQVLTYSWMLENQGENPIVVVALSNSPDGGIVANSISSVTARVLELARDL
ncbi:MAG: serine hydrolase [Gammaproteobacteria bacterium]